MLVRRALNLAMDKNALVQHVTRGGQKPASHYVPDIMGLGYDQAVKADQAAGTDPFADPEHTFNPPLARKLLKEAGYEVREENGRFSAQSVPPCSLQRPLRAQRAARGRPARAGSRSASNHRSGRQRPLSGASW